MLPHKWRLEISSVSAISSVYSAPRSGIYISNLADNGKCAHLYTTASGAFRHCFRQFGITEILQIILVRNHNRRIRARKLADGLIIRNIILLIGMLSSADRKSDINCVPLLKSADFSRLGRNYYGTIQIHKRLLSVFNFRVILPTQYYTIFPSVF